jgi:predicted N-acyltransferase
MTLNESTAEDYVIRVHAEPGSVDGAAWNALLQLQAGPRPSCATSTCWRCMNRAAPCPNRLGAAWLTLQPTAAAAGRLRAVPEDHSYGEYVFDWAWADAYRATACATTPSCWAPCPSRRCPGRACWPRRRLARAAAGAWAHWHDSQALSSAHVLFVDETDRAPSKRAAGCCARACSSTGHRTTRSRGDFDRPAGTPAARQAQEDPAGAPPRGRGRHQLHRARGAQIDEPRCGTSSTTATRSPTRRTTARPT